MKTALRGWKWQLPIASWEWSSWELVHWIISVEIWRVWRWLEKKGTSFGGSRKLSFKYYPWSLDSGDCNRTTMLRQTHWLFLHLQGECCVLFIQVIIWSKNFLGHDLDYRIRVQVKCCLWNELGLWSVSRKESRSGLFRWQRQEPTLGQPICASKPTNHRCPRSPSLVLTMTFQGNSATKEEVSVLGPWGRSWKAISCLKKFKIIIKLIWLSRLVSPMWSFYRLSCILYMLLLVLLMLTYW